MLSVNSLNLAQARDRLEKVKNELAYQTNQSAQKHMGYIIDQLQDYPMPRLGQRYVRTMTLKRGWAGMRLTPQVLGGNANFSITVRFANPAPYWVYVQDARKQSKYFKRRWKSLQQIIGDYKPTLVRLVGNDVQKFMDIAMDR